MEATRKLISKSGEVFASPVTYLASYVIPTEKRTAGELQTLNEILKLGGGGSGEKTKGDTLKRKWKVFNYAWAIGSMGGVAPGAMCTLREGSSL